ncbi:hypothetical protein ACVWYG_001684 [Pedobacter sp. UYEF25]
MKTKQLRIGGLLLLLSISIFACKKDEISSEPQNALSGAWAEVPPNDSSRRIFFGTQGNFEMELRDSSKAYWSRAVIGKYKISNDSLKVNITSEVEKSADGKVTKTTTTSYVIFDKGRFSIENDLLTIQCVTYPADGPVPTTFKYNRIIAID